MVPTKFAAVLLAAVVVLNMAAALPADEVPHVEDDEDHCTASMVRALGILRGEITLIEAAESLHNDTQDDLEDCKHGKPNELAQCEHTAKVESVVRAAKLLKAQVIVGTVGQAVMLHLEANCRPEGKIRVVKDKYLDIKDVLASFVTGSVIRPRDLNDCFVALDAGKKELKKLDRLISSAAELLVNILLEIQQCMSSHRGDTKKCALEILFAHQDEINAALDRNLRWKDDAEDVLDDISICLA